MNEKQKPVGDKASIEPPKIPEKSANPSVESSQSPEKPADPNHIPLVGKEKIVRKICIYTILATVVVLALLALPGILADSDATFSRKITWTLSVVAFVALSFKELPPMTKYR